MDTIVAWAPTVDGVELTGMPEKLASDGYFSNFVSFALYTHAFLCFLHPSKLDLASVMTSFVQFVYTHNYLPLC